jgi:flagellar assembly protein FliH
VKSRNVLDNTVASAVVFPELEGGGVAGLPESSTAKANKEAQEAERLQIEAEWNAKVNQAFDKGLALGNQRAAEKVDLLVQALDKSHRDLLGFREAIEAEAEKQAVGLAVGLAQAVIRTQVAFDPDVLRSALGEAVKRAPADGILRVRVNTDDLAAAEPLCGQLVTGRVEVVADPAIGRGGCVVETKLGDLESTIEQRWEAAAELLRAASSEEKSDDQ